jgi:uncharacterized membrane protein
MSGAKQGLPHPRNDAEHEKEDGNTYKADGMSGRPQQPATNRSISMRRLLNFLRATLVGGLLFLVPVTVLVVIVGKALEVAHKLTAPLAQRLPFAANEMPMLLASVLLALVCFVMGLLAMTGPARMVVSWLETRLLSKIPGYVFLKGAGESALGMEGQAPYPLVLARIEDAWQFGFLIERLEGGHAAVYVPSSPNPLSGSVYFMGPDRIRPSNVPVAAALKCLRQLGAGSHTILSARDLD